MKSIKMFVLVALSALVTVAFVDVSSALAENTQLCKLDTVKEGVTKVCPAGEAVTSVHAESVGKARFLASPEVQCNVLFSALSVGALGAPQVITGHFTYTNCGCTIEEEPGTTATIKVLREGHETGKATLDAKIVVVDCFGIECTYNGHFVATVKGPLLSSNVNGDFVISEQEATGSGFFCPTHMKLDITMTPLSATYIAS